ncbi:MAG: outer membrane beta-barrel protein [Devosia sp.]
MRKTLAIATTCVLLAGPAVAQEAAGLSSWNGPYAGLVLGMSAGTSTATTTIGCVDGAYLCDQGLHGGHQANGVLIGDMGSGTAQGEGPIGGVVAGYDWHNGTIVTGFVADASALTLAVTNGGTAASINPGLAGSVFTVSATASTDWLATLRGRAGLIVSPDLLLYVTGGVAITELTVSNDYLDTQNEGGRGSSSTSSLIGGYAFGGGAEWEIEEGWRLTAEYLFVDFGSLTTNASIAINGAAVPNPFSSEADLSAHLFKMGLSRGF